MPLWSVVGGPVGTAVAPGEVVDGGIGCEQEEVPSELQIPPAPHWRG